MAGWAAATETSAAHRRTLARAWHTQAVSTGTRVWVQASVRLREHTFRRDDELEEEDAEEKDTGYKPAAGQATQHVARLSGCLPVVAGHTGPSAAQLPLAGMPRKQGATMLELEITYQIPEKK